MKDNQNNNGVTFFSLLFEAMPVIGIWISVKDYQPPQGEKLFDVIAESKWGRVRITDCKWHKDWGAEKYELCSYRRLDDTPYEDDWQPLDEDYTVTHWMYPTGPDGTTIN